MTFAGWLCEMESLPLGALALRLHITRALVCWRILFEEPMAVY